MDNQDNQSGWIIVAFNVDNTVEAVLNIWLKNDEICAWPKSKHANKFIEKCITPNNIDFNFYDTRKLGDKIYSKTLKYEMFCNYQLFTH